MGDRHLFDRADVKNFARCMGMVIHECHEAVDYVADVCEAARLLPSAVNGEWFAVECLADKSRNDHPITADLPRSHSVEETGDDRRQLLLPEVREREELVDRFRTRVAPATFVR